MRSEIREVRFYLESHLSILISPISPFKSKKNERLRSIFFDSTFGGYCDGNHHEAIF